MKKLKVERRTISVCKRRGHDEWFIEWPSLNVTIALTPEQALAEVRAWAAGLARRLGAVIVTSINWYGGGSDFNPPRDDNDVRHEDRLCGLGDTIIKESP